MAAPASRALRRCICTAKQTAYARPTIGATQQRIQRRWQSDAAAPTNPKIATIVDQISQLTLLETADLVSTLKVGKFRILGEWGVYGYLCWKMPRDTAHQTETSRRGKRELPVHKKTACFVQSKPDSSSHVAICPSPSMAAQPTSKGPSKSPH